MAGYSAATTATRCSHRPDGESGRNPRTLPDPPQLASPLLQRPCDLRHCAVTWRLNSGVPPAEVAARAGHSAEVLMRTCARCMTGMDDVWISRMNDTLHPQDAEGQDIQDEGSDEAD
jgi:hypothetical protein